MPAKKLTVSITERQFNFLQENKAIKPSQIMQYRLSELMKSSGDWSQQLKNANEKIERIMETLHRQIRFIDSKNLMEEFSKNVLESKE